MTKYLTKLEVATHLRVSLSHVDKNWRKWLAEGRFDDVCIVARHPLFPEKEVEKLGRSFHVRSN